MQCCVHLRRSCPMSSDPARPATTVTTQESGHAPVLYVGRRAMRQPVKTNHVQGIRIRGASCEHCGVAHKGDMPALQFVHHEALESTCRSAHVCLLGPQQCGIFWPCVTRARWKTITMRLCSSESYPRICRSFLPRTRSLIAVVSLCKTRVASMPRGLRREEKKD